MLLDKTCRIRRSQKYKNEESLGAIWRVIDWGKYDEKDGRIMMPLSVQAHHSFVDGIHIGKFAEKIQDYLNCAEL